MTFYWSRATGFRCPVCHGIYNAQTAKCPGEGMTNLKELMEAYDWESVMKYADGKFTFQDIERVIYTVDGDNEGPDWMGIFALKNGSFGVVHAGCDYTGWGCQESGGSDTYETEAVAIERALKQEKENYSARAEVVEALTRLLCGIKEAPK